MQYGFAALYHLQLGSKKLKNHFFFKVVENYFLIIFLKEFEFFLCSTDFFLVYLVSEFFLRVGKLTFNICTSDNSVKF